MSAQDIISLAALKMEKFATAIIDKGYSRTPPMDYPIFSKNDLNLVAFVDREKIELDEALKNIRDKWGFWTVSSELHGEWWGPDEDNLERMSDQIRTDFMKDLKDAMLEIADVHNTTEYLFEALLKLYTEARP